MPLFRKQEGRQVLELPVGEIQPNPHQPRRVFPPAELDELSRSIAQVGVLQPLSVRKAWNGWELIAGERRLRAARQAGLATVPCLEWETSDEHSALLALVENLQRQNLDFWEEALALRALMEQGGLSQEQVAVQVGKSQSAVANKLRLLRLDAEILERLRAGGCGERHARALLRLEDGALQRQAAAHILRHRLTVSRTEAYIDRLTRPLADKPMSLPTPIYRLKDVRLFLNALQRSLDIVNASGLEAQCGREDTDNAILLTIRIAR